MKKWSIICSIIFVFGIIAGSVLAQTCVDNDDCDDGLYCNGEEICDPLSGNADPEGCVAGTPVECPDDSLHCTGVESCDEDTDACVSSGDPCDDGLYCNGEETCDESADTCASGINPCPPGTTCFEETDSCVFVVSMDIKPGSCQNPLNVRSRGVLPVVIHGSEELEVEAIDPSSIRMVGEGDDDEIAPIRWNYAEVGTPNFNGELCACDDLNGEEVDEDVPVEDGYTDLKLKFSVPALVEGLGLADSSYAKVRPRATVVLTMEAITTDGIPVMGQDCVQIINNWKWWGIPKGPDKPKEPKGPKGPKRK